MKTLTIIFISLSFLLAGCFAPINLTYDGAKTLDKGQIQVQGSYSRYNITNDTLSAALLNNNYGFSLGYGITDRYTMKVRYEYIAPTINFKSIFGKDVNDTFKGMNSMSYFEVGNKLMLLEDVMDIALELPLGAYIYNTTKLAGTNAGLGWMTFDPRVYFSFFRQSNIFELTLVPKLHVLFGYFGGYVKPGISLGIGLSSDLDKWAIRPEIGYDRFLSFGVGVNVNFNAKKTSAGN